ncbi:MAG: hypothetical protein ABIS50_11360 [Luteolibacter sp.]|uniref:hypothetical protein n=1 Tax=Luteolibacter sp. TaxID=1962973 RepID=UPI0032632CBC
MKFKIIIQIRNVGDTPTWEETYDSWRATNPSQLEMKNPGRLNLKTEGQANLWAEELIEAFNASRRRREKARQIVSIRIEHLTDERTADECCDCGWQGSDDAKDREPDGIGETLVCPNCGSDEFYQG